MTYLEEKSFFFVSHTPALESETFSVVNFKGTEGISKPYEFDINLVTKVADIDQEDVLAHPATLYLRPEKTLPVHGVLAGLEQQSEVDGNIFYRAVLVPRLWLLSLYNVSEVYLGMKFPDILEKVLQEGGLASDDYDLRFMRKYRQWSYVCQYQETHLDFISRWMEREGIYYFFEQTEDKEKMVITDTYMAHVDLPDEKLVNYSPPSGMEISGQKNAATAFISRQKPVPKKVTLQDFNYRKSPPGITGEAEVSPAGRGEVHIYGEHMKTNEEADEYAKLRAQEILCRKRVYHGETAAAFLRPGYYFELDRHYQKSYNRKYLITDISHEGSQAATLLAGINVNLSESEEKPYYLNSIEAIENDLQYRPERKTPKPRFYGTINAKVEAEGSGQYAELDQYGRYKVKLPFDRSDRKGQKASRWVRMASPYAGPDEGMHFPLRKGAEVLLTFMDGDPDRPIIASAVPSAEDQNVVNDQNSAYNMMKSAGGNVMHMHDQEGRQRMLMQSPTAGSWMRIGAYNDPPDPYNVNEGESLDTYVESLDGETVTWNLTSPAPPKTAAIDDDGSTLTYRLTKAFLVARVYGNLRVLINPRSIYPFEIPYTVNLYLTSGHCMFYDNDNIYVIADSLYLVFSLSESSLLSDGQKDSGSCTIENNTWTLDENVSLDEQEIGSVRRGEIQTEVRFYRTKDVVVNVGEMETVEGDDGIRIKTAENLWLESYHRYGEFYGSQPADLTVEAGDNEPKSTKQMLDEFGGDYNPSNLKARHGDNDTTTLEQAMQAGAHVFVSSFDSFITQEGNIYDFGGYWNYNLGNCYVEEHIDQQAELNSHPEYDLLAIGGPYWTKETPPWRTIKSSEQGGSENELDLGNDIWVEKKFGDSYEYYEGNQISVTKGGSQEIQIGGKHVEEKYSGSGKKLGYSSSESGTSEEYSWGKSGNMLSYSYKNTTPNGVNKYEFTWANIISAELSFSSNLFFSLDASARLGVDVSLGARASLDLSGALDFKLDFGLAAGCGLKGHLGGYNEFNVVTGKLESEMMGMQAQKDAALKGEKQDLVLKGLTTGLEKKGLDFEKLEAAIKKNTLKVDAGQLFQGL